MQKLLTRTQAAEYIGRNRRTLEAWEKKGIGPPVIRLPSGRPAHTQADLDAYIAAYRVVQAEASEDGLAPKACVEQEATPK